MTKKVSARRVAKLVEEIKAFFGPAEGFKLMRAFHYIGNSRDALSIAERRFERGDKSALLDAMFYLAWDRPMRVPEWVAAGFGKFITTRSWHINTLRGTRRLVDRIEARKSARKELNFKSRLSRG